MSRLTKQVLSASDKGAATDSPLAPPAHPDAAAGTHPSDHNAVSVLPHAVSEKKRRARREKVEKRRARDGLGEGERAHGGAFLVAPPLWYMGMWAGPGMYPGGVYPGAGAACVSDVERWGGGVLIAGLLGCCWMCGRCWCVRVWRLCGRWRWCVRR